MVWTTAVVAAAEESEGAAMKLKNFFENGHAPLPLPTDAEIERAKAECERLGLYHTANPYHEHPDCIRAAFAWLDAQHNLKQVRCAATKGYVESWANRYLSSDDMTVAAALHPRIEGRYPMINITKRKTVPEVSRLAGLEVNIHKYRSPLTHTNYGFETTRDRCLFPRPGVKAPTGDGTRAGADATGQTGEHDNVAGAQAATSIMPQRSSDGNVFLRPNRPAGGVR